MKRWQYRLCCAVLVSVLVALTGCAYQKAVRQLPPAAQAEFRAYSKVMTPRQSRMYLAKAAAAEGAMYLQQIGVAQRFQELEPQDREAVLAGFIRKGMSTEAMLFLWGEPFYTEGNTDHYEHWFYLGSTFDLAATGNQHTDGETMVDVYLLDGQVEWWREYVPDTEDDPGEIDQSCPGC